MQAATEDSRHVRCWRIPVPKTSSCYRCSEPPQTQLSDEMLSCCRIALVARPSCSVPCFFVVAVHCLAAGWWVLNDRRLMGESWWSLAQIGLLREYLDLEFGSNRIALPFKYDLERIIDDFVLFCMLVGNDFLPCTDAAPVSVMALLPPLTTNSLMSPRTCLWMHVSTAGNRDALHSTACLVPPPIAVCKASGCQTPW